MIPNSLISVCASRHGLGEENDNASHENHKEEIEGEDFCFRSMYSGELLHFHGSCVGAEHRIVNPSTAAATLPMFSAAGPQLTEQACISLSDGQTISG
jgi:hypothetical protein